MTREDGPVRTPCIGTCSTVFGDHVCRGCKRFAHEIIDWNAYDQVQKRSTERRLSMLLAQVLEDKVRVLDPERLAASLQARQLRFSRHRDPVCWVLDLLRRSLVVTPSDCGFEVLEPWQGDLRGLRDAVEREWFELSEAHYRRYVHPAWAGGGQTVG
jgi:hypothetical protein